MKRSPSRFVLWLLLLLTVGVNTQAVADSPNSAGELAQGADSLIDSLCVATHWSYTDTPYYQRYNEVKQKLVASGIRQIRDGLYANRAQDLGKQGIRMTVVADVPDRADGNDRTIQTIVNQVKAANAAGARIDAVEGPNEPDLFWAASRFNKKYKGQAFPAGVIAFQKDLYAAIKRDRATANLKVIGPSLGTTYDPGAGNPNPLAAGSLANAVDWGNFHPYPGSNPFNVPFDYNTTQKYYWNSNFPSIHIDEHPYLLNVYSPPFQPKPMAVTETGYSTYREGVSEKVQAKYVPRLFLEFFRKNIQRTCLYEFVDEFADRDRVNREANFGLLRHDLTPKPAYTAIQNLTRLLQDPGSRFKPTKLAYDLAVHPIQNYREPKSGIVSTYDRTQYVHRLLLQKRDGTFYLTLWHEISNNDVSVKPPREIQPPALPATLRLKQPIARSTLYVLNDDGSLSTTQTKLVNRQLNLSVFDRVTVIKLEPTR